MTIMRWGEMLEMLLRRSGARCDRCTSENSHGGKIWTTKAGWRHGGRGRVRERDHRKASWHHGAAGRQRPHSRDDSRYITHLVHIVKMLDHYSSKKFLISFIKARV